MFKARRPGVEAYGNQERWETNKAIYSNHRAKITAFFSQKEKDTFLEEDDLDDFLTEYLMDTIGTWYYNENYRVVERVNYYYIDTPIVLKTVE